MNTLRKRSIIRATAVIILVGLIGGLAMLSSSLAAAPDAPPQINILAIGDSNTYGVYFQQADDPQPAGWPKKDGRYTSAYAAKPKRDGTRASYRLPLYQLLFRQNAYSFGFVGNVYEDKALPDGKQYNFTEYPGSTGDMNYHLPTDPNTTLAFVGWGGKTTKDIYSSDPKWGLNYTLPLLTGNSVPNVALIHLGTNDINQNRTMTETLEAQEGILTSLKAKNSNMAVYIALIIPAAYPGQYCDDDKTTTPGPTNPFAEANRVTLSASCDRFNYYMSNGWFGRGTSGESPVERFNRKLMEWCQPIAVAGETGFNTRLCDSSTLRNKSVYLVDLHAGFDTENWLLPGDGIHPTQQGECQIGRRWYEALRETRFHDLPAPAADFCNAYTEGYVARPMDGKTARISLHSDGTQGDDSSGYTSVSADGRYVAFESYSNNLVPFDTNRCDLGEDQFGEDDIENCKDIFVHDRQTHQTIRVSVDSSGRQTNGFSFAPSISGNGRYVAFYSIASNLVANDTNDTHDVFVHDMVTSQTRRVSVAPNGNQGNSYSWSPDISSDGQYVAFDSGASNLVTGDTNGRSDIFVYTMATGDVRRVSVNSSGAQGNDETFFPAVSSNGQFITFYSRSSNLVSGDTNGVADVFVHEVSTGMTSRVGENSYDSDISDDGRYVVFSSFGDNLTPGDTNDASDIFLHDRTTGQTTRVSLHSNGNQANGDSEYPVISANGRYISYVSYASNLVDDDTQMCPDTPYGDYGGDYNCQDVFLFDRLSGKTTRVSVDSDGAQANQDSYVPAISANGRFVAFGSWASNLVPGDTNQSGDAFVRELAGGLPKPPVATPTPTATATGTPSPTPTATASPTIEPPSYLYLPHVVQTQGDLVGTGWTTGMQFQNVGAFTANIQLLTYGNTGMEYDCGTKPAEPGASVNYLMDNACPVPASFSGSGVAMSDEPVSGIVHVNNASVGQASGIYTGATSDEVSSTLFFPLVKHNHYSRTTTLVIQNAGNNPVDLTATFRVLGATYTKEYTDIPSRAKVIITPEDAGVPAGNTNVGSLTITATGPVAGASLEHQHSAAVAENLQAAKAFTPTDYDNEVYCPLFRNGHTVAKLTTGAQVQNVTNETQRVTLTYTPRDGGPEVTHSQDVEAGASATFYAPFIGVPANSVGSVTIAGTGNIVAVVNDEGKENGRQRATTYACFPANSVTNRVVLPLYKEFWIGNTSGIQIQNVGNVDASIEITYMATNNNESVTLTPGFLVPVGSSTTFFGISQGIFPQTMVALSGNPAALANTYGSVIIKSDTPIVAIANESGFGPNASQQDSKNYEGLNQ